MANIEEVKEPIDNRLKELNYELYELRFFRAGSSSVLRITVDSPDGIGIGDCTRISHEISVLLDEMNFSDERPYTLEVSSPGIDRPLKTERDFNRIIGRNVKLHLTLGVNGKKTIVGEVVECKDEKVTINFDKKNVDIPLSDIYSGKEEIRFK
jgi:ribosome maturation factor RimP